MRKLLLLCLLLISCSEIMYFNVEQMLPPEIMPKNPVRRIGVVNNFRWQHLLYIEIHDLRAGDEQETEKEELSHE